MEATFLQSRFIFNEFSLNFLSCTKKDLSGFGNLTDLIRHLYPF